MPYIFTVSYATAPWTGPGILNAVRRGLLLWAVGLVGQSGLLLEMFQQSLVKNVLRDPSLGEWHRDITLGCSDCGMLPTLEKTISGEPTCLRKHPLNILFSPVWLDRSSVGIYFLTRFYLL